MFVGGAVDRGAESSIGGTRALDWQCGKEFWGIGSRRELHLKIKGRMNIRVRREKI